MSAAQKRKMVADTLRGITPAMLYPRGYAPTAQRNNAEVKGVDTNLTLSPVIATTTTNGSLFTLNLISPGTGSFNRIGKRIHMKSLRLKGHFVFSFAPTATTSDQLGNFVRMVVVYDKQVNGVLPIWSDIFGITAQDGTESSTVESPLRYDNMDRFVVMSDELFACNPKLVASGGTTNQSEYVVAFDKFLNLKNLETTYSGQTSPCTIADVATGALYVLFRSFINTAVTSFAAVDGQSIARLRYKD